MRTPMIRLMMKYRIKPEKLANFQKAIEKFVATIEEKEKDILEYNVFQGPDGVSFVHYVSFADSNALQRHVQSPHAQKFNKILKTHAAAPPLYVPLNSAGQASGIAAATEQEIAQEERDTNLYRPHPELRTP